MDENIPLTEIILDVLEQQEDKFFSALAEMRDSKGAKTIKHEDAWK